MLHTRTVTIENASIIAHNQHNYYTQAQLVQLLLAAGAVGKSRCRPSGKARSAEVILAPSLGRPGYPVGGPAPFISVVIAGRASSACLCGDEVLNVLKQRSVRLRECRAVFSLASGVVRAGGAARLIVRWHGRMRRCRFIHLPRQSAPVILGRDFLRKSRITITLRSRYLTPDAYPCAAA